MIIILALILIAVVWYKLYKWRGEIVIHYEEVKRCEAEVNMGRVDFDNKMATTISVANDALRQWGTSLQQLFPDGISLSNLRCIGDAYPDVRPQLAPALSVVEQAYSRYERTTEALGKAIRDYNICVQTMPYAISASVFGYYTEARIDEANLENSKIPYAVANFAVSDVHI